MFSPFAVSMFLVAPPSGGVERPVAPPPRPAVRAVVLRLTRRTSYDGVVTAVDAESITLRGWDLAVAGRTGGWSDPYHREAIEWGNPLIVHVGGRVVVCSRLHQTRDQVTLTLLDGDLLPVRHHDLPVRRFRVSRTLAGGGFDPSAPPGATYRLSDVRVGDRAGVELRRDGDEDVAHQIGIGRRPGGRVPPAPGQDPDARNPHHERANAWQDFEERGIPLPDKYDPVVRREAAQKTLEIMQRQGEQWARDRLAPMPREARR